MARPRRYRRRDRITALFPNRAIRKARKIGRRLGGYGY